MIDYKVTFKNIRESEKFQKELFNFGYTWNFEDVSIKPWRVLVISPKSKSLYSSSPHQVQHIVTKNNKLNRKLYPEGVEISNYLLVKK